MALTAPREHGTVKGYRQHARRKEPTCEPCRVAMRPLWKQADLKRQRRRVELEAPCGTSSAYRRHLRRGESCEMCRRAATDEMRMWRQSKRIGARRVLRCVRCAKPLILHDLFDNCRKVS